MEPSQDRGPAESARPLRLIPRGPGAFFLQLRFPAEFPPIHDFFRFEVQRPQKKSTPGDARSTGGRQRPGLRLSASWHPKHGSSFPHNRAATGEAPDLRSLRNEALDPDCGDGSSASTFPKHSRAPGPVTALNPDAEGGGDLIPDLSRPPTRGQHRFQSGRYIPEGTSRPAGLKGRPFEKKGPYLRISVSRFGGSRACPSKRVTVGQGFRPGLHGAPQ